MPANAEIQQANAPTAEMLDPLKTEIDRFIALRINATPLNSRIKRECLLDEGASSTSSLIFIIQTI